VRSVDSNRKGVLNLTVRSNNARCAQINRNPRPWFCAVWRPAPACIAHEIHIGHPGPVISEPMLGIGNLHRGSECSDCKILPASVVLRTPKTPWKRLTEVCEKQLATFLLSVEEPEVVPQRWRLARSE
jgi:hypothetical protein